MLSQTLAVMTRVLKQLSHDRRFVGLSLVVPVVLIYLLWVFFDAVNRPFFNVKTFIPPVGAFIVHFLTYVLCVIVLVRERTAQTLERMFVSGYRRSSIITGYLLAYSLLATVQSLLVLIMINTLFKLNYSTVTFLSMYGVIWLLAIISIALGILISNFARNEGQVVPFIPLVIFPSVFFSGMILSVEQLPRWIAPLSYTTPMFYANEVIQAMIGTGGNTGLLLGLIVYGVFILTLAVTTLRE